MNIKQILLAGVVAGAAVMLPGAAWAGIEGSPHDFSGQSWNVQPSDNNSVCGTCHTPHHADSSVVPLWAHATTTASFTMYNAANLAAIGDTASQMVASQSAQPASASKACLSCHDGTVAINTYGGIGNYQTWGGTAVTITNSANLGTDLTHTHPISLTYNAALVGSGIGQDKWLFNPDNTTVLTPVSGTFNQGNDMSINGFLLGGQHQLECSSCHDVHNQLGTPYDIVNNPKLVKIVGVDAQNRGSLLCRSCHNK
jgi:hypothetical protein